MHHRFTALLLSFSLAACSSLSSKPKDESYKLENFAPDSPYEQSFEVSPTAACEAGRRALLKMCIRDSVSALPVRGALTTQRV